MARRHLRFRNFKTTTIRATDALFVDGPWTGDDEHKATVFETWLRRVADAYGVPAPTLEISDDAQVAANGGVYELGQITLPKYSVVLLFHQFRHHMQAMGVAGVESTGYPGRDMFIAEDDAISWACSLWYKVRPVSFRKAVRDGSIRYVRPQDLLATRTFDGEVMRSALDGEDNPVEGVNDDDLVPTADEPRWLSTTEVMQMLRRSRSWVCAHATELGGQQDERGRWQFPADAVTSPTATEDAEV
jgi:hypothetical protein